MAMRGAKGAGEGVHILTGPIYVCDAEPGDVLQVRTVLPCCTSAAVLCCVAQWRICRPRSRRRCHEQGGRCCREDTEAIAPSPA